MGKIKTCVITRDREVYRPGETITGDATLTVESEVKARSVNIFCLGMTLTKWKGSFQSSFESDYQSSEIYIDRVIRNPVEKLAPGTHQYKFSFTLPSDSIPSSFEGFFGSVRYCLRVEVDKPFLSFNEHFYSPFTVLAYLDANLPVYEVLVHSYYLPGQVSSLQYIWVSDVDFGKVVVGSWAVILREFSWDYRKTAVSATVSKQLHKAFGIGNAGKLSLQASIRRSGYCPGDKAKNDSIKDCGAVKASLVQTAFWKASSDSHRKYSNIKTMVDAPLAKGKIRKWHNFELPVDPVPPTINIMSCHIVKVTYSVNVCVEVPLGLDLEVNLPITICTVPLGMSVARQPNFVTPGVYECTGTKSVTYAACNKGFESYPRSEGNFMKLKYAPWTAIANSIGACASLASVPSPESSKSPPQVPQVYSPAAPQFEPPPSYEDSIANSTPDASYQTTLPPYEATEPQPSGKGSVMVILFSESDEVEVKKIFKKNASGLAQYGERVLIYQQKLALLDTQETGVIIIYFQSTQDGMGWFNMLQSTDAFLSSKLWVLIVENKVKLDNPESHREFRTMSIEFLKCKPDFKASPSYIEYKQLLNTVLIPTKTRFGGQSILYANCVTFISGDWSSLMSPDVDITSVITQWPSLQHYEEYTALFGTDPDLLRHTEIFQLNFVQLSTLVLEVGDLNLNLNL